MLWFYVILNSYDTKVNNLAAILLFCYNVLQKNADISQNVLPTKCHFFIFSYDVAYDWEVA